MRNAVGKAIYTFVGDGLTLQTSTAFGVAKHNAIFSAEDQGSSTNLLLYDSASTSLLTGTHGPLLALVPGVGSFHSWVIAVPEPSSLALLGLGVFVLIRRNRDKE